MNQAISHSEAWIGQVASAAHDMLESFSKGSFETLLSIGPLLQPFRARGRSILKIGRSVQ